MKTRKVGRVLSVLLAIVMVVALMIPASSVLAEADYTEIKTHNALKHALDTASTDPNNPTRIKLTGDIVVPVAKFIHSEKTFNNVVGYLATPDSTTGLSDEEIQAFIAQYFDGSGVGNGRFILNRSHTYIWNYNKVVPELERYYSFDEVKLEVPAGRNVVLDLNGYTIKMYPEDSAVNDGYQYRTEANNDPNPQLDGDKTVQDKLDDADIEVSQGGMSSVITVKGNLTLQDNSKAQTGKITGGTGNIIDSNGYSKTIMTHEYHVDFGGTLYSGHSGSGQGTPGWSGYNSDNSGITTSGQGQTNYTAQVCVYDFSSQKITKTCGGGIYVAPGANFTMDGGTITENTAWISPTNRSFMTEDSTVYALGGGVYVSEGATFTMNDGVIKMNTARAYQKETKNYGAAARGAGVYLAEATDTYEGAVMNFNGGTIEGNSTYANVTINANGTSYTEGAGVYVAEGAVMNMFGSGDDESTWPEIVGNYCGGFLNADTEAYLFAQGGGVQILGTVNMSRAFVRGNGFVPVIDDPYNQVSQNNDNKTVDIIQRWTEAEVTDNNLDKSIIGDVKYTDGTYLGTTKAGTPCALNAEDFVPYDADSEYDNNGVLTPVSVSTAKEQSADNWIYGLFNKATQKSYKTSGGEVQTDENGDPIVSSTGSSAFSYIYTNGGGINLSYECNDKDFLGSLNIGDRAYVFDNWDSVTNTQRYGVKNDNILGTYTYYTVDNNITRDNVCLNESKKDSALGSGHYQYIGCAEPATESRIGINTINTADQWVAVKNANENSLDSNVWGEYANSGYSPTLTDVQFFWDDGLNGEGKNYIDNGPEFAVIYESASDSGNYLRAHDGEDVLGFGLKENAYKDENGTYKTYVMLNYNEADLHRYSKRSGDTYSWVESYKEAGTEYWLNKGSDDMFSVELPKPNYKFYKTTDWTTLGGYIDNDSVQHKVGDVGPADSLQRSEDGVEAADLYFKGYQFYSPYGHFEMLDFRNVTKGDADASIPHSFRSGDLFVWNDNPLHISVPAYTAMWYTDEELAEARSRISGVKMQRVILKDGSEALRLLAVVGQQYAEYDSAGFIISTTNATPTVEGGYNYSIKTAIYGKILTKNDSTGNESVYVSSSDIMSEDEFANGKGILYTNLKMTSDADKATVYYVTPYAYVEKTDTYYYGKSRAVSYNYAYEKDVEAGISSETE